MGLATADVQVDGGATNRKDLKAAIAKAGGIAAYLRMTSGLWTVTLDDADPARFAVLRIASEAHSSPDAVTSIMVGNVKGTWQVTSIKRVAP
jgi:hypothetical protein